MTCCGHLGRPPPLLLLAWATALGRSVMKFVQTILLIGVIAFGLACGYSSKKTTPPAPGVTPAIAQLAPDNVNHGNADFTLTVNGSHFASDAVVKWNGTARTTSFVSAGQVTAAIAAADVATAGSAAVTVTNPGTPGGVYGGGTQ